MAPKRRPIRIVLVILIISIISLTAGGGVASAGSATYSVNCNLGLTHVAWSGVGHLYEVFIDWVDNTGGELAGVIDYTKDRQGSIFASTPSGAVRARAFWYDKLGALGGNEFHNETATCA